MDRKALIESIYKKKSFLCVGLDTDPEKIPKHLSIHEDPVFEFNKAIIDATKDLCIAYKINTAFYEAQGIPGWQCMQKTLDYIPHDIFTIADAKRGDIGNTSTQYAKAFFDHMNFHSITVAPYMGRDSVQPFLAFEGKWTIVLALTSNEGAFDFQYLKHNDEELFCKVIREVCKWGSPENLMFVAGATKTEQLRTIRNMIPEHFLLIPGVGTQGGDMNEVCKNAMNKEAGIIINVSRQVIYAGTGTDFSSQARDAASLLQKSMSAYL